MRPCGSLVAVVTAAASFHLTTSRRRLEYLFQHGRYLVIQAFFHRRQADRGIRGANHLSSRRHHGIFPKIEAALAQKKVGESCSVLLEPEDAFGEYDAD